MEGHQGMIAARSIGQVKPRWHLQALAPQNDALFVDGQAVEAGTEDAGESFEAIQGTFLLEDGGVTLDGVGTIENPGATTGGFLGVTGVGGRIGAQEITIWPEVAAARRARRWRSRLITGKQ